MSEAETAVTSGQNGSAAADEVPIIETREVTRYFSVGHGSAGRGKTTLKAVDGVSLTIASFDDDGFEVALIPHTLAVTTLGRLEPGDALNLEADVLGKVVERLAAGRLS